MYFPNCEIASYRRGYCGQHYRQALGEGNHKFIRPTKYPNVYKIKVNQTHMTIYDKNGTLKKIVLMDKEDLSRVKEYHWWWGGTAVQCFIKGKTLSLSALLLPAPPKHFVLHKNADPLDNRKANLVIVTRQQISINSKVPRNSTSKHKGIYWSREKKKWSVRVYFNGVHHSGGYYKELNNAIEARAILAKEIYGNLLIK